MSAWWEKEAQDYLCETLKFGDRQLCNAGNTNRSNRYRGKVVGDSPELCRGLDSHGFADLKMSVQYHASLSPVYPVTDPRRFNTGTPKEMWETLLRCWQMEPTSERVMEDILGLPRVLEKIIRHCGCVVKDDALVALVVDTFTKRRQVLN